MSDGHPMSDRPKRCIATSKQTGKQCGRSAIPGGTVCRYHGGLAPQVQESARARLNALVEPAIAALATALEKGDVGEITKAAQIVLDRCGFHPKTEVTGPDGGPVVHRIVREIVDPKKANAG